MCHADRMVVGQVACLRCMSNNNGLLACAPFRAKQPTSSCPHPVPPCALDPCQTARKQPQTMTSHASSRTSGNWSKYCSTGPRMATSTSTSSRLSLVLRKSWASAIFWRPCARGKVVGRARAVWANGWPCHAAECAFGVRHGLNVVVHAWECQFLQLLWAWRRGSRAAPYPPSCGRTLLPRPGGRCPHPSGSGAAHTCSGRKTHAAEDHGNRQSMSAAVSPPAACPTGTAMQLGMNMGAMQHHMYPPMCPCTCSSLLTWRRRARPA